MNLVERLIAADEKKAFELKRDSFKSKRLAELLGEEQPVTVTIKEIPQRKLNEIMAMQFSNNGNFQINKSFDATLMTIVEGVCDPSMKENVLQEHFRAESPKKLAEILFGREAKELSNKILEISGITEETGDDIKN